MTKARPAKTSASRARLPNMGTSLSLSRPGTRQITHTLLGSRIAPVADANSTRGIADNATEGVTHRRINPLIRKYKAKPGVKAIRLPCIAPLRRRMGEFGSALERELVVPATLTLRCGKRWRRQCEY